MVSVNQWSSDEEKKRRFLVELKNCKRQKLSEGVERDLENVALLESVKMNLGGRWIDEFRFTFLCLIFA